MPNPWHRRVRRALFVSGAAGTLYFLFSYLAARMRDARVRALRERRERETIKAHFTSLLSTISFTLYALLPNLEPQLFAAYPVETTSQALQAKSKAGTADAIEAAADAGTSAGAVHATPQRQITQDDSDGGVGALGSPADTGTTEPTPASTPADSLLLVPPAEGDEPAGYATDAGAAERSAARAPQPGTLAQSLASVASSDSSTDANTDSHHGAQGQLPPPGESWATEFTRTSADDDVLTASTMSQAISLPPTDTSSVLASPQSQLSQLESSPPRGLTATTHSPPSPPAAEADPRTKKQLWRDLKVQSLTRAFSTAYLVPLIYILTTSQLTILSRTRYLQDVQQANRAREFEAKERAAVRALTEPKSWLSYLSPSTIGLGGVGAWLPWGGSEREEEDPLVVAEREAEIEAANSDAERLFLTYSWWLLNEGWRTVAARVECAVDRVFGGLGLKRELTADTWPALVKEVRAQVETEYEGHEHGHHHGHGHHGHHKAALYDFTPLFLPPTPLPLTFGECPLPENPEDVRGGAHLVALLAQTREHVSSPDARALLDTGVTAMLASLTDTLADGAGPGVPGTRTRRLADLLPELNRWSRGVWEGIPDGGVEALLALPDFEAFAALIFGDWAPRA